MQDMQPDNTNMMPQGETDREGAMARADLYKLATYSLKLFKKLQDEDQLEGWVQAKITKAADYVASVYHYLEYEMKISEYGSHLEMAEVYSESQKKAIHNKLMEAKEKVKELKVAQAKKQQKAEKTKKVDEGSMFGGEQKACEACGGSGQMMTPERAIPEELKAKVAKYNRQAKAMHAASKRIDKNKNGIPDSEELGEDQEELKKTGDSKKTRTGTLTKTDTGVIHKNTSYADDGDADEKSGKGKKSHAKSQSAAEKKELAPKQKQSPKSAGTWGMKDSEKFDNRKQESVAEAKALKGNQKKLDADDDGDIEADDLADLRAGKKEKKVDEAKGKKPDFLDMDKDGDKKEPMKKAVADKKAGPKKGVNPFAKKTESIQVEKEIVAESADMIRMRQLMTRLNG